MDFEQIRTLPKAQLHDHLDGALRAQTVLELADEVGYAELPADEPEALERWFDQGGSGSLERYLEAYVHTLAVMQTETALERVAYESVIDLAADNVVYSELRFGPSLHRSRGLTREAIIEAVLAGLERGSRETGVVVGLLVAGLRQDDDSEEVARVAARYLGAGVVGFDMAGPEAAYPLDDYIPACRYARDRGLGLTLHAGEGDGPANIWRALGPCGAQRIGHGVRIIEDTVTRNGKITDMGDLARSVRDLQIPLEICITSNLCTGIAPTVDAHPFGALYDAGFNVSLNTDGGLMSGTTMSEELSKAAEAFGLTRADLGEITEATIRAGFGDWPARCRLITEVVRPAYTG